MQQVISPQKIEKEKVSLLYKLTREMLVWFGWVDCWTCIIFTGRTGKRKTKTERKEAKRIRKTKNEGDRERKT